MYTVDDLPAAIRCRVTINPDTGCWEFRGRRERGGYVRVKWHGHRYIAHRLVYMLLVGPIQPGLTLDHVKSWGCRSNACCWPAHLEPVSIGENAMRGTGPAAMNKRRAECLNGHPYTPENTFMRAEGRRECRTCMRDRAKRQYYAQAEAEGRLVRPKGPYRVKPSALSLQRQQKLGIS